MTLKKCPQIAAETFTFEIAVCNPGDEEAKNVVVCDRVPSCFTIDSDSVEVPGGWEKKIEGQKVTLTTASLAASTCARILITVTATENCQGCIRNKATVTSDNAGHRATRSCVFIQEPA